MIDWLLWNKVKNDLSDFSFQISGELFNKVWASLFNITNSIHDLYNSSFVKCFRKCIGRLCCLHFYLLGGDLGFYFLVLLLLGMSFCRGYFWCFWFYDVAGQEKQQTVCNSGNSLGN